MHITVILVLTYIACCVRVGAAPWKYFQLNARYFSREKGIFSKLSIDELIPDRWRLPQTIDGEQITPSVYPVFLKPEWGQNGSGIERADSEADLQRFRLLHANDNRRYMIQEAAPGAREFEIFGIKSGKAGAEHDLVTVTESVNHSERYPINSIHNRLTEYHDKTADFSREELSVLSGFIQQIGNFAITRVSARADNKEALLRGNFKIIEINLFIPMPINLLDPQYSWGQRFRFILKAMMALAHATRAIQPVRQPPAIFTRMMLYGRIRAASQRARRPLGTRRTHP